MNSQAESSQAYLSMWHCLHHQISSCFGIKNNYSENYIICTEILFQSIWKLKYCGTWKNNQVRAQNIIHPEREPNTNDVPSIWSEHLIDYIVCSLSGCRWDKCSSSDIDFILELMYTKLCYTFWLHWKRDHISAIYVAIFELWNHAHTSSK